MARLFENALKYDALMLSTDFNDNVCSRVRWSEVCYCISNFLHKFQTMHIS